MSELLLGGAGFFTIFELKLIFMLLKPFAFLILTTIAFAGYSQCDSSELIMEGKLITNTSRQVQIALKPGTVIPAAGTVGELSKYFETTLFGFLSTGWLNIAIVEITGVKENIATVKVLYEQSEMVFNGDPKNHFEKGNEVQFIWKEAPRKEPYYKIKDGDTLAIGTFFCEQKTGEWTFYYPSGQKQEVDHYVNGLLEGKYHVWNEKGTLIEEGNFNVGKRDGTLTFFYDNGKMQKRETWLNDELNGLVEKWYPNGNREYESNYVKNILHGTFRDYFTNGNLKVEGNYVNGEYDGEIKVYYENGNLKYQTTFSHGKKNGRYFGYHESGKPFIETDFANGEIDGSYKEFYESGQLRFNCMFTKGSKNGPWVEYYENGNKASAGAYTDGKKSGYWEEYYEDGSPASKGTYVADVKTGKWFEWTAEGKKTKTNYN